MRLSISTFATLIFATGVALVPGLVLAQAAPGTRLSFQSGISTVIEGYEGAVTKTSNGDVWLGFVDRPQNVEVTKGDPARFEFRPGSTGSFEFARRQGNRTPSYVTVDLRALRNESMTVRGVLHEVTVVEAVVSSSRPAWSYRMQAWVDPKMRYMLRREVLAMSDTTPSMPNSVRVNNIQPPAP